MGSEVLEQHLVDVRCLQLEFRGAASVCIQGVPRTGSIWK